MLTRRLKQLRKTAGLTQNDLAQALDVSQQAVAKWEAGQAYPSPDLLPPLAALLGVSLDYLLGGEEQGGFAGGGEWPLLPVIGTVKAGYDAPAYEEELGREPARVRTPELYFYLRVSGDSMEPYIHDGDLALVRRQPTLENGELGVFIYGDGEGTLKCWRKRPDAVALEPFNPAYQTLVLTGEELQQLYIVGKVVETRTRWD